MSSDESHQHDKEPIILTSPRRLGKGLAVVVVTMAVGAAILIPFFNAMYSHPPPVTQIRTQKPATAQQGGQQQGGATGGAGGGGGAAAPAQPGTTTIAILQGSAVQGSPDYDPDEAQVPMGNKVVWDNQDTVPHTATSGTGPQDADNAKAFDTSIINPGEQSPAVELKGASQGQSIPYHCMIHPFMTGQITVAAAAAGGGGGGASNATTGTATPAAGGGGPTINILEGASVQGSPDYDPDNLTAKKGDQVTVVNQDTVPHTATAGTGPQDPNSAKLFDTSLINPGESATISLAQANPGEVDFYCMVHPYMTGKITVG